MRIAFVSATSGIDTQTHLKAQGMAARGHDVWVVAMGAVTEQAESRDGAVRVLRTPSPLLANPELSEAEQWPAWSEAVAEALRELHERERLDVVDFPERGGVGYRFALDRLDPWVPMTVHVHEPPMGLEIDGIALRRADRIYASSAYSANWVAHAHGLDPEAIEVLHMGVDTARFHPGLGPKHVRPTVLYAGALTESSGAPILLEAVLKAAHAIPALRVRMLGRGPDRTRDFLRARVAVAGQIGILDLPGDVAYHELPHELCRGHVFVLPTRNASGAESLLEAMACGLPVIACSGSGAAEVVEPGANGLLVPPDDPNALAEALVALADPGRREAMAAHALAYAREEASCVPRLDRLEELLLEVASGRVSVCRP
jgi:glycosyltransferase involved in cell wall biosynthesis